MRIAPCVQPRRGAKSAAARWHPYPSNLQLAASALKATTQLSTSISPSDTTPSATASSPVELTFEFKPISPRALVHKGYVERKLAQKEKFETTLKELAVKRIAEIWKDTSYVINSAYGSQSFPQGTSFGAEKPMRLNVQNLLSPLGTPSLSPNSFTFQAPNSHSDIRHMPLRAFVYDVIRRSRTTWPALQVALCYLDAVREKVPDVIKQVNHTDGLKAAEVALDSLFVARSSEEETARRTDSDIKPFSTTQIVTPPLSEKEVSRQSCTLTPSTQISETTVPLEQSGASQRSAEATRRSRRRRVPLPPPAPLPPRPSPLLCPRRMFVAALILACKFTLDRVYSNRAWAKICGLEPREISRCERALGEALEWRLWVGKGMNDEPGAFLRDFLMVEENVVRPPKENNIVRSKSDSALLTPSSWAGSPFAAGSPDCVSPHVSSALKRSSSLNATDFLGSCQPATPMLNHGSSHLTTPPNVNVEALRLEQEYISYPTPFVLSFTSCEYSFIPATGTTAPLPNQSYRTPESLSLSQDDESGMIAFSPFGNNMGAMPSPRFDPVLAILSPIGIEGTHDMGIVESTDFNIGIVGTPSN